MSSYLALVYFPHQISHLPDSVQLPLVATQVVDSRLWSSSLPDSSSSGSEAQLELHSPQSVTNKNKRKRAVTTSEPSNKKGSDLTTSRPTQRLFHHWEGSFSTPPQQTPHALFQEEFGKPSNSNKEGLIGNAARKRCYHCNSANTPEWRTGPLGRGTLCNACGLRYQSKLRKNRKEPAPGGRIPISLLLNPSPMKARSDEPMIWQTKFTPTSSFRIQDLS